MSTPSPSPACIPVTQACIPTPQPGTMCLKVINLTSEVVDVTQVVSGATPMCFTVGGGATQSVLVNLNSTWSVIGETSGTVYYAGIQPRQATAVLVADSTLPSPPLACPTKKTPNYGLYLIIGAAVFLLIGVIGSNALKKTSHTAVYQQCLSSGLDSAACEAISPSSRAGSTLLTVGVILAILCGIAWFLLVSNWGTSLTGDPKDGIGCEDCYARGDGWVYTEPSKSDNAKQNKAILWLRKMRCRLGGKCVCTNDDYRRICRLTAGDPKAPPGLEWQTRLSSIIAKSPSTIPGDVCACCTTATGGTCFNVVSGSPIDTPCAYPV